MPGQEHVARASPAHVRAAAPADVPAIADVQLRAWLAGCADRLPASVLAGLTADDLAARWSAAVQAPPTPRHRVLVAVDADSRVAGFAAVAPAADADLGASTGELLIVAVDPDAGRRGHGSRLLHAAVDGLRGDGCTLVVAWLLATDDALRALLVSSGWAPDGAWRELDTGAGQTVRQVRLHTSID